MCQSAITLITNSLPTVTSDELLLKIKGRVALFMLTMEVGVLLDESLPKSLTMLEMGILRVIYEHITAYAI
jgi:hypothetical protein